MAIAYLGISRVNSKESILVIGNIQMSPKNEVHVTSTSSLFLNCSFKGKNFGRDSWGFIVLHVIWNVQL